MLWRRKTEDAPTQGSTPPAESEKTDPELESAVESVAAILRARARHAFSLGEDDATSIAAMFERWALHVLVRAPAPGQTERPRGESAGSREWRRLVRFASEHAQKEQTWVERSVREMREAIFLLVESFSKSSSAQGRGDFVLRRRLETLRVAVDRGSIDDLKREALSVATAVTRVLDEQKSLAQRQAQDLRARLVTLGEQLEQTKREADTDPLTSLANRRVFDLSSERAVALSSVMGQPLTLLMVDIDHFKAINDNFGHPAGDKVLRVVADALVRAFPRRSDVVARYGGEEFAILLTDTASKNAAMLAERLLSAVRALQIDGGRRTIEVTVSVGFAELAAGEETASLVARADRALYAAKKAGRNRAVEAEPFGEADDFDENESVSTTTLRRAG